MEKNIKFNTREDKNAIILESVNILDNLEVDLIEGLNFKIDREITDFCYKYGKLFIPVKFNSNDLICNVVVGLSKFEYNKVIRILNEINSMLV